MKRNHLRVLEHFTLDEFYIYLYPWFDGGQSRNSLTAVASSKQSSVMRAEPSVLTEHNLTQRSWTKEFQFLSY